MSCCECVWSILAVILVLFVILYNVSETFHYYSRISFFYVCIFIHGIECLFTMIPSYLRGDGADLIFHTFYYWCLWTGIKVEVRGYDEHLGKLKESKAVVLCNHQSALDVVAMNVVWPRRCVVMMKRSLMYVPIFNLTSYLANSIFIDRFNREKAMAQVEQCTESMEKKNLKLWVFPEGTRYREHGMLPFKKGAFNIAIKAQIPIVPIVCSNYSPFYSKDQKYFRNDGEVIAQVLPPVSTVGLSMEDCNDLVERVRNDMLKVYDEISAEAAEKMRVKREKKSA